MKYMGKTNNVKSCCLDEMNENGIFEIQMGCTNYKISTVEENNCLRVFASPCTLPSTTFEIAQVCKKDNKCMQFDFYEAQVYTDPVEIIIDCNLCQIIKRALEIYIEAINDADFGSSCNRRNSFFGF